MEVFQPDVLIQNPWVIRAVSLTIVDFVMSPDKLDQLRQETMGFHESIVVMTQQVYESEGGISPNQIADFLLVVAQVLHSNQRTPRENARAKNRVATLLQFLPQPVTAYIQQQLSTQQCQILEITG